MKREPVPIVDAVEIKQRRVYEKKSVCGAIQMPE